MIRQYKQKTYPEAMTLGELSYWKFSPVLCKKSPTLLGGAGVECVGSQTEYWQSDQVDLTLWNMPNQCRAHWHRANPAIQSAGMCLGCQWLVSGAHDKALAAFPEPARHSKLAQRGSEIRASERGVSPGDSLSAAAGTAEPLLPGLLLFWADLAPGHVVGPRLLLLCSATLATA